MHSMVTVRHTPRTVQQLTILFRMFESFWDSKS